MRRSFKWTKEERLEHGKKMYELKCEGLTYKLIGQQYGIGWDCARNIVIAYKKHEGIEG